MPEPPPSVIVFDLDDTLAPSKCDLDPSMAELLDRLLGRTQVCVISGGRFEQFERQVVSHLPVSGRLHRLHLMPTCGTRYYRWDGSGWSLRYAEDLDEEQKRRTVAALLAGAEALGLTEARTWGPQIEDRGSQITFSALGQQAPVAAKHAWDPGGGKREQLRSYVAARLPDLEVRSGGSTSVDVTRSGIDKAYGVRKLCAETGLSPVEMLFVGDRLDVGGNDYPVRALGIPCLSVTCWEDTRDWLTELLASAPDRSASASRERAAELVK